MPFVVRAKLATVTGYAHPVVSLSANPVMLLTEAVALRRPE